MYFHPGLTSDSSRWKIWEASQSLSSGLSGQDYFKIHLTSETSEAAYSEKPLFFQPWF
jgi:hypothetical protein